MKRAGRPSRLAQIQADLFVAMLDGRYHHRTHDQIVADMLRQAGAQDASAADPDAADASAADAGTADASAADAGTQDAGPEDPGTADAGEPDSGAAEVVAPNAGAATAAGRWAAESESESGQSGDSGDASELPDERVGIEIRIGLSTLLGLDSLPGEIPSLGPVCAEVARATVAKQRRGAQ